MVAREGFVYEQKPLSVTRNVVVREGWSLVRVVVRQGFTVLLLSMCSCEICVRLVTELSMASGAKRLSHYTVSSE